MAQLLDGLDVVYAADEAAESSDDNPNDSDDSDASLGSGGVADASLGSDGVADAHDHVGVYQGRVVVWIRDPNGFCRSLVSRDPVVDPVAC